MKPLVNTLPPRYRDAIVLAELEGFTQLETAQRLGLSLSGAKSRVYPARKMLEAKLLDCCRVEHDSRGAIVDYESAGGCGPVSDCGPGGDCDR